jgi:hypothetical protein
LQSLATLLVAAVGCSSPTAVVLPPLEVVVASGDEQYGTTEQDLSYPLRVMVRTLTGKVPQVGTSVSWDVIEGDASFVGASATATDTTGSAEIRVRLGASTGTVVVEATALSRNNPSTTFRSFTVDRPALSSIAPASGPPGSSITLSGANFSPDPAQNVVLFSGIRGRVTAATAVELTVEVPPCLPARPVSVSAQLGVVASGTLPFTLTQGGDLLSLPVGGAVDVADDDGYTCLGLPGNAQYLTIVYSAGTVGAGKHPFSLTGLSASGPMLEAGEEPSARLTDRGTRPFEPASSTTQTGSGEPDPQAEWDRALREREAELARRTRRGAGGAGPVLSPAAAPPAVGARRTFDVYSGQGNFTKVTAVAVLVGARAALFVDEDAPSGGFTQGDLAAFADRFDDVIHPVVTSTFGSESDLDQNERVVILFTPAVNALTPRGSSGFIGGFFFGIDLLPDQEGSNGGEVFYSLVPDPAGVYSDPRPADAVLEVTPAVLAHEFQHMVHFNERVLVREAESTEALWLSEGLAQYAEEAVALEYEAAGDANAVSLFRSGTRTRSRRYAARPDTVSLIISTGSGTIEERGAGFLHVMYLQDQEGGDLLGRLTRTTRTGVANVEAETGRAWGDLLGDWWSAIYLDGPGPETGPYVYPVVDLRGFLGNPFPLVPVELGAGDFGPSDSLWSSSAAYYIVTPSAAGSTSVRLGGEAGAPSSRQAGLRMKVIRIS